MGEPPRTVMQVGEVMFGCGKAGFVHVTDEHDVAGERHSIEMNQAYFVANGRYASVDQQMDWVIEGEEASRRRMTIRESKEVNEASALLQRHGFSVVSPPGEPTQEGR